MPTPCPSCNRILTNRKVKKCLMCGAEVPEELLLPKEQVEHFEKLDEERKKDLERFRDEHNPSQG